MHISTIFSGELELHSTSKLSVLWKRIETYMEEEICSISYIISKYHLKCYAF